MTQKNQTPSGVSLTLGDIYHVLFRHKGKIAVLWALGMIAGAILWFTQPVMYQSSAQLLIRYVTDTRSITSGDDDAIQTPNSRGSSVMSSEKAILQTFDLARTVAEAVGPSNVLAKVNGGSDLNAAAGVIRRGLTVEVARGSAVMAITFQHPDSSLVQPILNQIVASYLRKHAEVHLAAGTLDEVLTRQTDQLRSELQQTEQELRNEKAKIGVISLDESKRACADQIGRIRENLFAAEAELKAYLATFGQLTNMVPATVENKIDTNSPPVAASAPPPEKVAEYNRLTTFISNLRKIEQDRLLQFTPESPRVAEVQRQIKQNEAAQQALEKEFPQLIEVKSLTASVPGSEPLMSAKDVWAQKAAIARLQTKIEVLNQQMKLVRDEAAAITAMEGTISDLERKRELLERNYTHFSASLNNARFDEAIGTGRVTNISTVETPTPAGRALTKTTQIALGVAFGSLALGIALAFLIELYLDRSIRRPIEIEQRLKVPLFVSIPRAQMNGKKTLALANGSAAGENGNASPAAPQELFASSHDEKLRTYFETLRDRLLLYFEANNLVHKPKLVAVTGCGKGGGVSTVASGLAATLSETGDGNVLLVDMNELERGAAAYFHHGKLECGLDEVLEGNGKRENAMVHDNLYVVTENPGNRNLPRILHKRFASLMPKLRASDYDYIIFDMPPVSQISPTSRLAQFMDMVFLVVESEKSDRDVVKRAVDMLTSTKANVGVVLNKTRTYVPKALQQEL